MSTGRFKKGVAKAPARREPQRGRSGGRSRSGAGYDFQDVYLALQLAKLLMGDRDPLVQVLWEKKALDNGAGTTRVHVDDAIIRVRSGQVHLCPGEAGPRHAEPGR